jgi:two-component system sensor histidine kinase TctE
MSRSLRRELLAWVLLPLITAIAVDTWLTYRSSFETASVVQDRLLLGSARMIAQQISFEEGSYQYPIPPAALELFQSEDIDRIFYRITTSRGQLLAGYSDLPVPTSQDISDSPHYFGATIRDRAVRVVAVMQPVIGNPSAKPVIVEVAQTTNALERLTNKLWFHSVVQQLLILALATVFILFGLRRGLQPLIRLRDDVRSRKEGSLQLLQKQGIPSELMPLVDSFNDYIQRLENYVQLRSNFVENAAHQLRTPLTVLHTQINDASLAEAREEADLALRAARKTLQQTTRIVNQFLTLSATEAYAANKKPTSSQECCNVVQKILEDLAFQAHAKYIDLGFERTGGDTIIPIDSAALREIALNLVDNAIRYTQEQGIVTARIDSGDGRIAFTVEDNGPGVPAQDFDKIFQRFYRAGRTDSTGSGLGLAIVKDLVALCDGTIRVGVPTRQECGLIITVEFSDPGCHSIRHVIPRR